MDEEIIKDDWNIHSIINFIKENVIQILLFILVFVIIFVVDYISNINATIFGVTSIPGIPSSQNHSQSQKKIKISKKVKGKR